MGGSVSWPHGIVLASSSPFYRRTGRKFLFALAKKDVSQLILFGHSMGALVAYEVAAQAP